MAVKLAQTVIVATLLYLFFVPSQTPIDIQTSSDSISMATTPLKFLTVPALTKHTSTVIFVHVSTHVLLSIHPHILLLPRVWEILDMDGSQSQICLKSTLPSAM